LLIRHPPSASLCRSRHLSAAQFATGLGLSLLAATTLVDPSRYGLLARANAGTPQVRAYTITPERQALLNTIRYAEGTWNQGALGYRTLYGGGAFESLDRHPEIVVVKRYRSAAAGAYQFLPSTWREASHQLQLQSFQPHNQDQAALYLVDRRGVLEQIDRRGLTREAMAVLAKEWASFPTLRGASAYGQPVQKAEALSRFYATNLQSLRAQA
jgi:lysozyme